MRTYVIVLLALPGIACAQNWALLNPAYKYNYSLGGTDTISDQIAVVTVDTLGPNSYLYELRGRSAYCDTCVNGTGGVAACNGCYIWSNAPEFMGRQVMANANEWTFASLDSAIVRPEQGLGASWTYTAGSTATIVAVDTLTLWGALDSIKTISIGSGDTLIISREHGVLRSESPEGEMILVGIEGPDEGIVRPPLQSFFPYQFGDVLEYAAEAGGVDGIGGGYGSGIHFKLSITGSVDLTDSILFIHEDPVCEQWSLPPSGDPYVQCADHVNGDWHAAPHELPYFAAVTSFPGQLIFPSPVNGFEFASCIAVHLVDPDGRYHITTRHRAAMDPELEHQAFLTTTPTSIPGLYAYTKADDGSMAPEYGLHYLDGVGLWRFSVTLFETGKQYVMIGASIAGDTIGTIHSTSEILGMSGQIALAQPTIFPSLADDVLHLEAFPSGSVWTIHDPTGKQLATGVVRSAMDTIELQALPAGPYMLEAQANGKHLAKRFFIVR